MNNTIQRVLIALYAIGIYIANKFCYKRNTGRVLIIFQQVFGDSVILLPALEGYIELYYKRRGYDVTMLCLPSIKKFLSDVADVPENLRIEVVDFKKLVNDFKYFKEIVNKYREFAEISIVAGSSLSGELLSTTLCAKERHGLISCFRTKRPLQMALFQRLAYSDVMIPPIGSMMIERHGIMLRHLGLKEYKGHLSSLLLQKRIVEGKYCVICPGASTPVKRWVIDRFQKIADWIIETYDMDIHLCGGLPENEDAIQLMSLSRHSNRIFNHVGKTTFKEWSSIVQHAYLVVGNDSATLHIAAATHRKCICITGIYDKFQFFPYKVEELRKDDALPTTVIVDKPCAYCRTKGYYAGYGNKKCKIAISEGKCSLCISEITVDMVKSAIEKAMSV